MIIATIVTLSFGLWLRFWLSNNPWILNLLNLNELSSPISSWKRVEEGLWLKRNGILPYTGDTFHQTPLFLEFADWLDKRYSTVLPGIFVVIDFVTAIMIGIAGRELGRFMLLLQQKGRSRYHEKINPDVLLKTDTFKNTFYYCSTLYLLNPYSALSCTALSVTVLENLLIATTIYFLCKGSRWCSMPLLALLSYQSFYPVILLLPATMMIVQIDILGEIRYGSFGVYKSIIQSLFVYTVCLAGLFYVSYALAGHSWNFLHTVYGFILTVPELAPNSGVFWYFITEMFAHFEIFFLIVFQTHMFIYPVPLTFKFRYAPSTVLYVTLINITIFKSYPTLGEIGFYISLFPVWYAKLHRYYDSLFIMINTFIWCSVLSPIFYHLWIYSGSANANFYFALTLVFSFAQILFMSNVLQKTSRRHYDLYNTSIMKGCGDEGALPYEDDKDIIID